MLPDDVWFHVEDLSSAHVYLRLKEVLIFEIIFWCGKKIDKMPLFTYIIVFALFTYMTPKIQKCFELC